jgi:S-DNA-T family DNA segregation ATPase FtsK/SpoIIIE
LAKKLNKQKRLSLQQASILFFVGLALLLFLALLSYHPSDPGFFTKDNSSNNFIQNKAGAQGAWIADLFFGIFGNIAYIIPMILIPIGFNAFRIIPPALKNQRGGINTVVSVFGAILALLSISSLAHMLVPSSLPNGAGGSLGMHVSGLSLESFLGYQGSVLMMSSSFLIGITLAADIQWGNVTEKVGDRTLWLFEILQNKLNDQKSESDTMGSQLTRFYREVFSKPIAMANNVRDKLNLITNFPQKASQEKENTGETILQAPPVNLGKKEEGLNNDEPQGSARIATERLKNTDAMLNPVDLNINGMLMPSLDLLNAPPEKQGEDSEYAVQQQLEIESLQEKIPKVLNDYGIKDAEVTASYLGPIVTRFEIQLSASTKVSKVSNLSKDLARNLGVSSVRVVEVIPGKTTIGLEVPNEQRDLVTISAILSSALYKKSRSAVTLILGKDIAGASVIIDLAKMPHLLIAGTTGSGKSVAINTMLISMLYKSTPEQVRLLLIDPKMLELSIYEDIPHLLTPVITDMKQAANSLRWCITEMEHRYLLMSKLKVRGIAAYNEKIQIALDKGKPLQDPLFDSSKSEDAKAEALNILPHIVVVVDEFADMMMVVGKTVEDLIARIAQKARAAGIHLILATQRPSVDVITGLIKANIPTRISFQVSTKIDSRSILDQAGAESLLGNGDMLYLPPGTAIPQRVHGAFISDDEVNEVVKFIRSQREPEHIEGVIKTTESGQILKLDSFDKNADTDPLYNDAIAIVTESRRASISYLQRRLKVGYNRAAQMIEDMQAAGVVSAVQSNGTREVIVAAPKQV